MSSAGFSPNTSTKGLTGVAISALILGGRAGARAMTSNQLLLRASELPMLAVCVCSLVHCVQLEDSSGGAGGSGGGAVKTWGMAERIHSDGGSPDVAIDPAGDAVSVWTQSDGIGSSRYTPSDGWSSAELISRGGEALENATVAMDANGNAVAVWSQFFVRDNIFANRWTLNGEWGIGPRIDDDSGMAEEPQVSMNAGGTAVAVWVQFDGTRDDVWSNRYSPSTGWGDPERIETSNATQASGPQVAIDPNGNAVAVWAQLDGTREDVWSNRYTTSSGWGAAERIEFNNAGDAKDPQIGVDAQGNAVAVWTHDDGVTSDIWSSRYTPSTRWGDPERIEVEDEGDAEDPHLAVAPDGSAVAVWSQFDGTRDDAWSNRYTPGGGWSIAERIEVNDAGSAVEPRVAVDSGGNAVAVWRQFDGTGDNIWSNRYVPGSGWGAAQRIDTDDRGTRSGAGVAMNPTGTAVAVWRVFGGSSTGIWSNRLE